MLLTASPHRPRVLRAARCWSWGSAGPCSAVVPLFGCCEVLVAASSCPLWPWLNAFGLLSQQKGPAPACWVNEVEPFGVLGVGLLQTELHLGSPQRGTVVAEVRGKRSRSCSSPAVCSFPLCLFMLARCSFCARLVTGLVSKLVGENLVAVKERAQEKVGMCRLSCWGGTGAQLGVSFESMSCHKPAAWSCSSPKCLSHPE